jgi:uncharacterized RmlC-like cupin family protein
MSERKYGKYILTVEGKGKQGYGTQILSLKDSAIKGSWFMMHSWITPTGRKPVTGAHYHEDEELIGFLGNNPDDPGDLGAVVELYIGEEMEEHVITRSCIFFVPKGLVHCPLFYPKVDRPFIFILSSPHPEYGKKIDYKSKLAEEIENKARKK